MSGFQDPFSGVFNWSTLLLFGWLGFIAFVMLLIFIGFDSGGFLHRIERFIGIRNLDAKNKEDE